MSQNQLESRIKNMSMIENKELKKKVYDNLKKEIHKIENETYKRCYLIILDDYYNYNNNY